MSIKNDYFRYFQRDQRNLDVLQQFIKTSYIEIAKKHFALSFLLV